MTLLDYAPAPPKRRFARAADVAFVTSLAAWVALGVSLLMYVNRPGGMVRTVQIALAWTSMALAAVGLVAAVLACFVKPRGVRLWLAFAALVGYAIALVAALRL